MKVLTASRTLAAFLLLAATGATAANVRGQVRCNGGGASATGMAVTLTGPRGRTATFFTGGDGMFYFNNLQPGQYTIDVWFNRRSQTPGRSLSVQVHEPLTDVPRILVPVCFAQ